MANKMLTAYIEAALFSSFDRDHDASDLAPETLAKMAADCAAFEERAGDLLDGVTSDMAGYDFWMTRNGHGVGFWMRDLEDVGDKLTELAHSFGESDLYLGDDGRIYVTP